VSHSSPKANILINEDRRACLADFGLSTITGVPTRAGAGASQVSLISDDTVMSFAAGASRTSLISNDSLMSFTAGGTYRWMSPELLDPEMFGIPRSEGDRPTRQSDCYALGMVIYEVRVRVGDSRLGKVNRRHPRSYADTTPTPRSSHIPKLSARSRREFDRGNRRERSA
jgi:serine/threonine protein kinase